MRTAGPIEATAAADQLRTRLSPWVARSTVTVGSGCRRTHPMLPTREYLQLGAPSAMCEIETNSVGSGATTLPVDPGWMGLVGSPPRGIDRAVGSVPTRPGSMAVRRAPK